MKRYAIPSLLALVAAVSATAAIYVGSSKPYSILDKPELLAFSKKVYGRKESAEIPIRDYADKPAAFGFGLVSLLSSLGFLYLLKQIETEQLAQSIYALQAVQNSPSVVPQTQASQPNNSVRVSVNTQGPKVVVHQPSDRKPNRPANINDVGAKDRTGAWIDRMLLDNHGRLKLQHYRFDGVSQSGKTTFAEEVVSRISKFYGEQPDVFLINPKHLANKPQWSFKPFCSDIDTALTSLQFCVNEMTKLQKDPNFDPDTTSPVFVIVDEVDWILSVHKTAALTALRTLIKVGAALKFFTILIGQSPLASSNGTPALNGSDYRQMVRGVLRQEAIAFLNNPQFVYSNRKQLMAEANALNNAGERFILMIEHEGEPHIEIIPYIEALKKKEELSQELEPELELEPEPEKVDKPLATVTSINRRVTFSA